MTNQASAILNPAGIIGEVHDYIYGVNWEHIGESVYGGAWAEMLKANKFAEPDPRINKVSGRWIEPDTHSYGVVAPWQAINPDFKTVYYSHDNTTFYTGTQSQRVQVLGDNGQEHGIRQSGLHLQAGRSYQLRLVLQGSGQNVRVQLGDQSWVIPTVADGWSTYRMELTPAKSDQDGALTITFRGVGNLWIGRASLMPADHIGGYRRDVISAIKDWGPTYVRWPGGDFASAYHWMDGIGDPDRRPTYKEPAWSQFDDNVNFWETNDVGTDEFIAFCRLIGSEPTLVLNMGTGTVEEAVAWVEYCNGAATTHYGSMRAANGNPEPYNLKWWFAGNQIWHEDQFGHSDPETYARRYLEYARAIRMVDPTLKIIGSGMNTDRYDRWNELLLNIAGAEMDALSVHYYSVYTKRFAITPPKEDLVLPKLAAAHEVAEMLDDVLDVIAAHSDPPVPIAFTEWNTYLAGKTPTWHEDYDICDALYGASVINACIQRCDGITNTAIYNLINVLGNYRVTPQSVWKTPTTLVLEVMTRHRGPIGISCQVESPTFSSPAIGGQNSYEAVPTIDAAATCDPDTGTVYFSVVNRDIEQAASVQINGLVRDGAAKLYRVSADHPLALNTEVQPEAVKIEEDLWQTGTDLIEVPPLSFTLAVIPVKI
jgi:alpha-N-arabinofuranosidase